MSPSLVSVIIPAYNHERYVYQALESVVNQDYPALEILVVDDGSKDGTSLEIERFLLDYPDANIRFIRQENMGLCRTLNLAIRESHGEYICALASDDCLLPGGITGRVRYLEQFPEKWAVFSDCNVVDTEGNILHRSGIEGYYASLGMRKRYLTHDASLTFSLIYSWAVPGPVFLCRREMYERLGYYDEILSVEDWDLYLRLAGEKRLGFLDACVASYRIHPTNTVGGNPARLNRMIRMTAEKHIPHFTGLNQLGLRLIAWQMRAWERSRNFPVHRLFTFCRMLVRWGYTAPMFVRSLCAEKTTLSVSGFSEPTLIDSTPLAKSTV